MEIDKSTLEAKILKENVDKLIRVFNADCFTYTESEVEFRVKSIKGMLLMIKNDCDSLHSEWLKQCQ